MRFDISVVIYQQAVTIVADLLDSLASQAQEGGVEFRVSLRNNNPAEIERWNRFMLEAGRYPFEISMAHSPDNLGFGLGHNATFESSDSPFFFVLNPDTRLLPNALRELREAIESSANEVGAWELRQVPYEHPKLYDPVTLRTDWVAGAAVVFRRVAFAQVGGFEPRIFMYGEDVDLSWRLRAEGWMLRYVPRAVAVHHTYAKPGEVKPLQITQGVLASLQLRTRFGSWVDVLRGLACWLAEFARPARFAHARRRHLGVLFRYMETAAYFRRSGARYRARGFRPEFRFWGYGERRDGAFVAAATERIDEDAAPLVSIIVRTHRRPALLREALMSLRHQTYPRVEVVVVEDGPDESRDMIEREFAGRLELRYQATGVPAGRSAAGNLGLSLARGEWIGFLDDDDQFYADHVETLMRLAQEGSSRVVYSAAHEVPTEFVKLTADTATYREGPVSLKYRPYSRAMLWQENLMPIQAALFHRSLPEAFGGFDEDLDQLEDWVLWVRYSCATDFSSLMRVTSRYRVPMSSKVALARQAKLHDAYAVAVERQRTMRVTLNPREIVAMCEQAQRQALSRITRQTARKLLVRVPFMRCLLSSQAGWRRRVGTWRRRISPRN
ncbi:glycosyltransferase family 2 protein [Burkholderia gladioli]|uniref:glycosyltransferase family 2 protein n=1 Tax=Burkholderia gladioli TaxID=28095 RepID=UPI00164157F8|nr:glycosyltransferase [Burkholderia gladioli]MBJ9674690.1 glycosyltransferase [Burkholderia gladioli]MDN7463604.1 glycosyltransferase [Burkholderia gladioli]